MQLESQWPPKAAAFFAGHPDWAPSIPSGIPKGWDTVVAEAMRQLDELRLATGVRMELKQVKEKFGGLRMYLSIDEDSVEELQQIENRPGHERLRSGATAGSVREQVLRITDEAERAVELICAGCGAPATRRLGYSRFCGAHDSV